MSTACSVWPGRSVGLWATQRHRTEAKQAAHSLPASLVDRLLHEPMRSLTGPYGPGSPGKGCVGAGRLLMGTQHLSVGLPGVRALASRWRVAGGMRASLADTLHSQHTSVSIASPNRPSPRSMGGWSPSPTPSSQSAPSAPGRQVAAPHRGRRWSQSVRGLAGRRGPHSHLLGLVPTAHLLHHPVVLFSLGPTSTLLLTPAMFHAAPWWSAHIIASGQTPRRTTANGDNLHIRLLLYRITTMYHCYIIP